MTDPSLTYGGRLRIRVNGLLVRERSLLLVNIWSPVVEQHVWMPPGGGLEYGESMPQCLAREFREETGLEVTVGELRHINELLDPPYHAVEFYFEVEETGGELQLGIDPEHASREQLLRDARFIPFAEMDDYDIVPAFVRSEYAGRGNGGAGPGDISYSRPD
ncbi:MAG: NUDIX domain-containing protein [Balneolaceae bacterium]|nr:NUDIX domain-containing protein [Balneolaceae bacterium]